MQQSRQDDREWLAGQVAEYSRVQPDYIRFAELLEAALSAAADELAPLAIVQTRAKTIASFAAKALRKRPKYDEPVRQLTDLTGARVITHTRGQVEALGRYIKAAFDVDWPNSIDTSQRLGSAEFGYRSVHYIVSPRRDLDYGVAVPDTVYGRKAEIQVRTLVEHAYADFAHDVSYKGAFELPRSWLRELAGAAAALETADQTFSAIEERVREFSTSYGAYLDDEELATEMHLLRVVREHVPHDPELAHQLARLALTRGDWDVVVSVLSDFVDADAPERADRRILRDLGVAICKAHRDESDGEAFHRGRRYLTLAAEGNRAAGGGVVTGGTADPAAIRRREPDPDALAALAGTWKGIDDDRAAEYYRRAFEADPADPYALGNHLERELVRDPQLLETARPLLFEGIDRCEGHAAAGVNLPWAYYDLGRFRLLVGEPLAALDAYARALTLTTAPFMVEGSIESLRRMAPLRDRLPGYDWSLRLLLLGAALRFPSDESNRRVQELATPDADPLQEPVLILAGGTDPRLEPEMDAYRSLLLDALEGFRGTLLSGGTAEGIAGIAGDAAASYAGIQAIGYLPELVPSDATPDRDPARYAELRQTDGHGFSPLEPLQNWIDLVASGVAVDAVRVLGVNGGAIAAAEYRLALALGARVGLLEGSGREAGRIFSDQYWSTNSRLVQLPVDAEAVRAFVPTERPGLDPEAREAVGRAIHERYRETRRSTADPALADWAKLPENLKTSNREQADHIPETLAVIGCRPAPGTEGDAVREFTASEVERMAKVEHGRWVVERLLAGWRRGERDHERKTSPYLVAWEDLPDEIRELDRSTVRQIPELLAEVGMRVVREAVAAGEHEKGDDA